MAAEPSTTTSSSSTNTNVEALLPSLKEELGEELSNTAKDYNLLKYLYWKPDVKRAAERYRSFLEWRHKNPFAFDSPPLQVSQDKTLQHVLESQVIVAPEGMVDQHGHTVLVGRLRNNDMSDGRTVQSVVRMAMYTIDRVLERPTTQQKGVIVFHDLRGVSPNNIDIRIPKLMLSALTGHLPIRIQGMYLFQAPFFFKNVVFPIVSLLFPKKLKSRIHFLNTLEEIYKVIDQEQMLVEHGGTRQFDVQAWVAEQIDRETNGSLQSLGDCSLPSAK